MRIFGITGGTGAGKSTASAMFAEQGVYVIDGDKVARRITEPGEECLNELAKEFGREILNPDGTMNRAKTAQIVFSDPQKLAILTEVTHKYINKAIISELERVNPKMAAIDGAVIIGSPVEENCEFIVSVTADEEIRIKRIIERDGISAEAAKMRIAAQPPEAFYIENSRYIIKNNGDTAELKSAVEEIVADIKKECRFE